eukprot:3645806-Lingulodinium_polyedra.AAC.1
MRIENAPELHHGHANGASDARQRCVRNMSEPRRKGNIHKLPALASGAILHRYHWPVSSQLP